MSQLEAHQLRGMGGKAIEISPIPSVLDDEVAALLVTEVA